VWWSKVDLIHRAMANTDDASAWWIDFGIAHASVWPGGGLESLGEAARISLGVVADAPSSTVEEFLRGGVPATTGGLIGVPRGHVEFLRDRVDEDLRRAFDLGLLVNDEALYSLLLGEAHVEGRRYHMGDVVEGLRTRHDIRRGERPRRFPEHRECPHGGRVRDRSACSIARPLGRSRAFHEPVDLSASGIWFRLFGP